MKCKHQNKRLVKVKQLTGGNRLEVRKCWSCGKYFATKIYADGTKAPYIGKALKRLLRFLGMFIT